MDDVREATTSEWTFGVFSVPWTRVVVALNTAERTCSLEMICKRVKVSTRARRLRSAQDQSFRREGAMAFDSLFNSVENTCRPIALRPRIHAS